MLHLVESLGQHTGALPRDGLAAVPLFALLLLAACACPALADEPPSSPEDQSRIVADEVLRRAGSSGPEGLGDWTKSVIGRALERAGEAASDTAGHGTSLAPLSAEQHAASTGAGLADRPDSGEVLVFLSLAVPPASWNQWAREAARTDVPLVLRGVASAGLKATVAEIRGRLGGAEAGVAIDPRLFRLFGVTRVPAVVVVPGGVPPCRSRGCAEDPAPPHDRITGNIGLVAALEAVANEGAAGRDVARARLERLTGE